jgi:hypothetical protein
MKLGKAQKSWRACIVHTNVGIPGTVEDMFAPGAESLGQLTADHTVSTGHFRSLLKRQEPLYRVRLPSEFFWFYTYSNKIRKTNKI